MAESWTLDQLEAALKDQLCGRYLRAKNARHGILLLVHQKAREKGWQDVKTGQFLSFTEVVERLKRLAIAIAGGGRKPLKSRSPSWMYQGADNNGTDGLWGRFASFNETCYPLETSWFSAPNRTLFGPRDS